MHYFVRGSARDRPGSGLRAPGRVAEHCRARPFRSRNVMTHPLRCVLLPSLLYLQSGDVTLRGAVTWSAPDGQKQVWAVITVDEVFTFFEHVVDKLDFLDMHRCWKLEDLVADKVATEAGTQYELPGAEATDLKTHAF